MDTAVIWVSREAEYFFEGGWTDFCPTGKSLVARMQPSEIRGRSLVEIVLPDCAWPHPGYACVSNMMQGVGPQRQRKKRKRYAYAYHQGYQRRGQADLNTAAPSPHFAPPPPPPQAHPPCFFRRAPAPQPTKTQLRP